jgi:hypothetical protein
VALALDQKFALDFERANKRGCAHSAGSLLIGYRGYCSAKKNGCPMTFKIGFSEVSIRGILQQDPLPPTTQLEMHLTGMCIHV